MRIDNIDYDPETNKQLVNEFIFSQDIYPSFQAIEKCQWNDELESEPINRGTIFPLNLRRERIEQTRVLLYEAFVGQKRSACLAIFLKIRDQLPCKSMRILEEEDLKHILR